MNPNSPARPDRAAHEARADALGDRPVEENVFSGNRHEHEIERAENIAAGLPPEGLPAGDHPREPGNELRNRDFRRPHLDTPEQVQADQNFKPVPVSDVKPKGFVDRIQAAANKVITKVKRFMKPEKRVHKEVVSGAGVKFIAGRRDPQIA